MKIQAPKGTFDILPYAAQEPWQFTDLWTHMENILRQTAAEYGYREIRTPIYERTELFDRGVGETSDIVMKEMFTFKDRGDRLISLRPEGTASVARAFVEHHLAEKGTTHKFFYIGPMFRYERPQSGRYRQHHQFGVEAYGQAGPEQDVEVIDLLLQMYKRLGIEGLKVHLNTVGDAPSRAKYREALLAYLAPQAAKLSEDSKLRLEKNPLRILDSKDPVDREIVHNAPSILDYLTAEAKAHFNAVCHLLGRLGISYVVDHKLVRGLDYYNKTVFEVLTDSVGAQNTMGAGGRYDGLLGQLGGPDLPAVGFATGFERVMSVMTARGVKTPKTVRPLVYFIPMGDAAREASFLLVAQMRHTQLPVDLELGNKKVGAAIQHAVQLEATYACVVGDDELAKGRAKLKNLANREETEVALNDLIPTLSRLYDSARR